MPRQIEPERSLSGRLAKIESAIKRLQNRSAFAGSGLEVIDPGQTSNSGSMVIPDDGLLLVDGGDFLLLDKAPSAQVLLRVGTQEHGDRGLTTFRSDGSVALEVRKVFGPGDPVQAFMMRDRTGARIGGDSILSSSGFDVPHIPMPFTPVDYTSASLAQSTSSATFVATHEHRGFFQNPALKPQLMIRCSDGTTSAEVQFFKVGTSAYLGGYFGSPAVHTITVPAGTTTFTLFELASGALQIGGSMSDPIHLQIHVRRTAGSGSVTVAPVRTVGSGF